jgi:hypothetical protein
MLGVSQRLWMAPWREYPRKYSTLRLRISAAAKNASSLPKPLLN